MAFLSSRFTFSSSRGQFHSSGMANGDSVTGAGSTQSFEQRQQVEKNRQTIAAYRDAAVANVYRKEALAPETDDAKKNDTKKHYHRTSRIDMDEQSTSRIRYNRTSRIDIVKPSRQAFNSGQPASSEDAASKPPRYTIERPSFKEPDSRGYNPYS